MNYDAMKAALRVLKEDCVPVRKSQLVIDELDKDGGGGYALDVHHRDRSKDPICVLYPEGCREDAEDDRAEILDYMNRLNFRDISLEQFADWMGDACAVEVQNQFVIYPPHLEDGEIRFHETEDQDEPYFVVDADWELTICDDGSVYGYNLRTGDDCHVVRLMREGGESDSEKYALDNGEHCPNPECRSLNVEATDSLDHCGHLIYQSCRCVACGREYTDIYGLKGMEPIVDPELED